MASNEEETLKVTITDVPAISTDSNETKVENLANNNNNNSSSASQTQAESNESSSGASTQPKVIDVDENLNVGSLNIGYSSWWGSLIKTAKEKSKTAIEAIKTDLAEFKTTMKTDTNALITQITNIDLANNAIITNLNSALSSFDLNEETKDTNKDNTSNTSSSIYERYLNELKSMQSNRNTFLSDPANETTFEEFKSGFDADSYKNVISDLLIENSSMRLLYSQLVPSQISNNEFWSRYFFKVNLLEEEHKKRVKLIERATISTAASESTAAASGGNAAETKEESTDWGSDFEDDQSSEKTGIQIEQEKQQQKQAQDEQEEKEEEDDDDETKEKSETVAEKVEQEIVSHEVEPDKIRPLKPEESDEWEKVSDEAVNENDNGKKSDAAAASQTTEQKDEDASNEEEKLDEETKHENKIEESSESRDKKSTNNEWDEWDE